MWFTHCRGWTYPAWRSNHCSPRREEEGLGTDTSRTLRHIKVPAHGKILPILGWHQQRHWMTSESMPHMSESLNSGAKANAEANTTMTLVTTRSWLHDIRWKWILFVNYYSKMLIVQMPISQCNCAKTITILNTEVDLQNMEFQKRSNLTMYPSFQVTSSLS